MLFQIKGREEIFKDLPELGPCTDERFAWMFDLLGWNKNGRSDKRNR